MAECNSQVLYNRTNQGRKIVVSHMGHLGGLIPRTRGKTMKQCTAESTQEIAVLLTVSSLIASQTRPIRFRHTALGRGPGPTSTGLQCRRSVTVAQ